jgi:hypothetical protein
MVFAKGARVHQPDYGPGTIVETNEHHTLIAFDHAGVRKFVTSMVSLTRSDAPAPAAAPKRGRRANTSST